MSRPAPRRPLNPARRPTPSGMKRPQASSSGPGALSRHIVPGTKGNDDGYLYVAGVKDPSNKMVEFSAESDVCPVCKTDRQFNKNLRLLVSPCYHKMCESCIDRLFTRGPEPCPQCGKILRKVNFAHQTFEDLKVEKEVAVRRRMAESFNKRAEDFETRKEYDQYLEDVEDMTFNLLNDIDVAETEAKMASFATDNASLIAKNRHKAEMESMSLVEREEVEKTAKAERLRMIKEAEVVEKAEDERVQAEIVDAMSRPDGEEIAKEIRAHAAKARAARAAALDAAVPLSAADLKKKDEAPHTPNSPAYHGPYVPIPYADPDSAAWSHWYSVKDDYADGRRDVISARGEMERVMRAGGYDLGVFWEMEVRSAIDSLSIEPL